MINVPNSSRFVGGGGGSGLAADGGQWFELPDRLVLNYHAGNNAWDRSLRRSWRNVSGTLNLYASDDTTVTHSWNALGDATMTRFLTVGANSPTGAAVGTSGIGLGSGKALWSRNNANSANMFILFTNASDQLEVGTDAGVLGIKIGNGSAVFKKLLSNTATLDFPNTLASACSDLTMGVTGAADGDPVFIGPVNASVPAGGSYFAWVSTANTITVRFCADGSARDPANGTFRVTIVKF
ncbi:MAG TPA: hypothetical protein VGQ11_03965 [Candidatus Acidoferrales bacterium]|nr:hypothetical protein [Candidatus Acidoferrales bacterium]